MQSLGQDELNRVIQMALQPVDPAVVNENRNFIESILRPMSMIPDNKQLVFRQYVEAILYYYKEGFDLSAFISTNAASIAAPRRLLGNASGRLQSAPNKSTVEQEIIMIDDSPPRVKTEAAKEPSSNVSVKEEFKQNPENQSSTYHNQPSTSNSSQVQMPIQNMQQQSYTTIPSYMLNAAQAAQPTAILINQPSLNNALVTQALQNLQYYIQSQGGISQPLAPAPRQVVPNPAQGASGTSNTSGPSNLQQVQTLLSESMASDGGKALLQALLNQIGTHESAHQNTGGTRSLNNTADQSSEEKQTTNSVSEGANAQLEESSLMKQNQQQSNMPKDHETK